MIFYTETKNAFRLKLINSNALISSDILFARICKNFN